MLPSSLRLVPLLTLLLVLPARLRAQDRAADTATIAEVRATIRRYDEALRRSDTAAVAQLWAPDYTFINPRGELLTRADRLANLRAGRTAFDSLAAGGGADSHVREEGGRGGAHHAPVDRRTLQRAHGARPVPRDGHLGAAPRGLAAGGQSADAGYRAVSV
jgi:hypothetical protein